MPIYEYQCPLCDYHTEKLQRIDADPPFCEKCSERSAGSRTNVRAVMVKQISQSSFALKGEGWFSDHYGLKPAPATPKQD